MPYSQKLASFRHHKAFQLTHRVESKSRVAIEIISDATKSSACSLLLNAPFRHLDSGDARDYNENWRATKDNEQLPLTRLNWPVSRYFEVKPMEVVVAEKSEGNEEMMWMCDCEGGKLTPW
jgi:hypothetical protein